MSSSREDVEMRTFGRSRTPPPDEHIVRVPASPTHTGPTRKRSHRTPVATFAQVPHGTDSPTKPLPPAAFAATSNNPNGAAASTTPHPAGAPTEPGSEEHSDMVTLPYAVPLEDDRRASGKDMSPVEKDRNNKKLRDIYTEITSKELSPRQRFYHIIHGAPALETDRIVSYVYNGLQLIMVALTTIVLIIQSMPDFYTPERDIDGNWAFVIESITVVFFTVDYILRVSSALKWSYILQPTTVIDLFSIAGYYLEVIIISVSDERGSSVIFQILRFIRVIRVSRLFKLSRMHKGLSLMWEVIVSSKDGLFLLLVLVLIATLFFSSLVHYAERTGASFDYENEVWIRDDGTISPFQSIPHTFWFVVASTTTVGYGDDVPYTLLGRIVAMFVMLFGVLVLSFPNILIGSNFQEAHRSNTRNRARRRLGVYFRRVRMVVRFIRFWREFRVTGSLKIIREDPEFREELSRQNANFKTTNSLRAINFLARASDFSGLDQECLRKLQKGELEHNYKGITFLNFMQRLLEGFSTVASIDEMTESYMIYPFFARKVRRDHLFEAAAMLATSNLIQFFVMNRAEQTGLLLLTRKGLGELRNFAEGDPMPCMRSYADARIIWTSTTKLKWQSLLPMDCYRSWQEIQATVPKRSMIEFAPDFTKPEAKKNHLFHNPPPHHTTLQPKRSIGATGAHQKFLEGLLTPKAASLNQELVNSPSAAPQQRCSCPHCSRMMRVPGVESPSHVPSAVPITPLLNDVCFPVDEEYLELQLELAQGAIQLFQLKRTLERAKETTSSSTDTVPAEAVAPVMERRKSRTLTLPDEWATHVDSPGGPVPPMGTASPHQEDDGDTHDPHSPESPTGHSEEHSAIAGQGSWDHSGSGSGYLSGARGSLTSDSLAMHGPLVSQSTAPPQLFSSGSGEAPVDGAYRVRGRNTAIVTLNHPQEGQRGSLRENGDASEDLSPPDSPIRVRGTPTTTTGETE